MGEKKFSDVTPVREVLDVSKISENCDTSVENRGKCLRTSYQRWNRVNRVL